MKAARLIVLVSLVAAALTGCAPSDPRLAVLEERARWEVQLLSWAEREDGSLALSTRVSGPPTTSLERLTYRIVFLDADGEPIGDSWRTVDLTEVRRGGPKDLSFVLPAHDPPVEQMRLDPVPDPTPEEAARIPELAGLG